jgi:uncharacterized lipoprotein YmbA
MPHRTPVSVVCALAAALAGCASPRSDFYTLSRSANPSPEVAAYSVSVGPVSVPAVVDRPQIVVRTGPNRVFIDEFNRWGSPLSSEIARAVAGNLASLLGTPHVTVFPHPTAGGARFRVVVDVMAFDSAPGDAAGLDAAWTVRDTGNGAIRPGRTTVREAAPDKGYAGLAAAHSRAMGKMSGDIADAIRALERGGR